MKAYLDIVKHILENGTRKENRTGIDTLSCFSLNFRHDLADGFPLLTTKKMDGSSWNSIVHELLWFLSGENHIRNLREKTKIWNSWADENGDLESAYGWYWRHFPFAWNAKMQETDKYRSTNIEKYTCQVCGGEDLSETFFCAKCKTQVDPNMLLPTDPEYYGVGNFDQVSWIIDELKKNPNSRRLVCSAWEPFNAHQSKLPPCHFAWVVNVQDNRLCLQWLQRSVDSALGLGFNICSYALLCHILANECNLKPGILSGCLIDAHIYCADENDKTIINGRPRSDYDHVKTIKEQIKREPYPLPTIEIANKPWNQLQFNDFKLIGYKSHPPLKFVVAI